MGLDGINRTGQDSELGVVWAYFHHLGKQQRGRRRADHLGRKSFGVGQQPFVSGAHPRQAAGIDLYLVGTTLGHLGLQGVTTHPLA